MTDRPFTHPNFGNKVRVEHLGREVRLIFVAKTRKQSDGMCDELLRQLKAGALNITLMDKPIRVIES